MPNFNIQSTTPGSAVSDTVQEILQRRREQARQMMMDKLGIAKFGADEEQRGLENTRANSQLDIQGRTANANIAADKARQEASWIDSMGYGSRDVTGLQDSSPDIFNALQKRALLQEEAVPGAPNPDDAGATDPLSPEEQAIPGQFDQKRFRYIGSPDFQKASDERTRLSDYVTTHKDELAKPENAELAKALGLIVAGGMKDVPDGAIEPLPTVTPISPEGNARSPITLPRKGQAMELNWPTGQGATNAKKLWQLVDKDGKESSFVGTADDVKPYTDAGYTIRQGNQPVDTKANQDIVPYQMWQGLVGKFGQKGVSPQVRQQALLAQMAVIKAQAITRGVDPQDVDLVTDILKDIDSKMAVGRPAPSVESYLMQLAKENGQDLTELRKKHIASLLQGFYGVINGQ